MLGKVVGESSLGGLSVGIVSVFLDGCHVCACIVGGCEGYCHV